MEIKQRIIEYRNAHKNSRVLLGTVLGELDRTTKNPTDADCIAVLKKLIAANVECGLESENEVLELFVPKQLSKDQIKGILSEKSFTNIGDCMKFFKENHAGLYDGKEVSSCFKELN